jgi:hypothetical protein
MTDKELLELAAKAAGIELDKGWLVYLEDDGEAFNPLVRDDHALRLAVKLGLGIEFFSSWVAANGGHEEDRESDPYAATRRAIVRAAAEIGRGME